MRDFLSKKRAGFYFLAVTVVLAVISLVRFLIWAPGHHTMDSLIVIALVAGIVLDLVLSVHENEYLLIAATVCYSVAFVRLLTDSVGSFVDVLQGINMFGDSSQIGTIISISMLMGAGVLLSVIASFTGIEKEQGQLHKKREKYIEKNTI